MLRTFTISLLLIVFYPLFAQVVPAPGAKLNYTQVMFEHPEITGASQYVLQLFQSAVTDGAPLMQVKDSSNASMLSGLQFGKTYAWRYAGLINDKSTAWYGPYNFEIKSNPFAVLYKVRVIGNNPVKSACGLICIDYTNCIFDRLGNAVLFIDNVTEGFRKGIAINDLTLTRYGTITYLGAQNAFETNLKDSILWMTPFKAPDPYLLDLGEFYNHDFRRIDGGHYMVIGSDYVWKEIPSGYDISGVMYDKSGKKIPDSLLQKGDTLQLNGGYIIRQKDGAKQLLMDMSALCEFDQQGHLIWSWYPESYIKHEDIFPPGGVLNWPIKRQDPHFNGFSMDAKNEFVYASFRNLSRVVKLDKKTATVVQSWGEKRPSGDAKLGNNFFRLQHYPNILANGNIAVFDNEDPDNNRGFSGIKVFSQPVAGDSESKITWSFECNFDSVPFRKSMRGGDVEQLPNNNFLVCMGAINHIFEVNPDKQIVWNAYVEKTQGPTPVPQPLNRTHFTSSLYPCYFTIQTDKDSLAVTDKWFKLRVFNVGTESDSYTVNITGPASDARQHQLKSLKILPGKSTIFSIVLGKPIAANQKIKVSVMSDTNTNFERHVVIYAK